MNSTSDEPYPFSAALWCGDNMIGADMHVITKSHSQLPRDHHM